MLRVCALSLLVFHFGNAASIATADNESEMEPSRANETWIRTNSIGSELCATVDANGGPVCSRKYLVGKEEVNFNTAVLLCNQIGMEIASPMSADENAAIEKTCRATAPGINVFWIGGRRCTGCLSEFIWITSGKPVVYRNFHTNQPSNYGNDENCLRYEPENSVLKWNDDSCDKLSSFVCQSKCCCNNN